MTVAWPDGAAALLAAAAAAVAFDARPGVLRLRRMRSTRRRAAVADAADAPSAGPFSSPVARGAGSVLLAGASAAALGGHAGLLVGVGLGVVAWRWLGRVESAAAVRARDAITHALPLAAELLSAAVAAGTPPAVAVEVVSGAVGGRLGSALRDGALAVRLGVEPAVAWRQLAADPALRPLVRALTAAVSRGRSPVAVLDRFARDARDSARAAAEARARSVGARAALPLGLCFLPAFVLVGIVPVVLSAGPLLP